METTQRKVYRARTKCSECDEAIRRGMPVVYVGRSVPIHAICERLYELRVSA